MTQTGSHGMGLAEAATAIREGALTSRKLVEDCLDHIASLEDDIGAWAYLNPEKALGQADRCDETRKSGAPTGPLHGVPIGIKDIFDTAHVPTEYGCSLTKGRIPFDDAWTIARLRQCGAVIMGKTVTAELAVAGPGKTRNPHNTNHTPGGSSSGSAAAVASYMVPGALGTQTGGSMIRPASFCGIYGFKPSHGLIPRTGVLLQSPTLDHVGTYARSIGDIALLTQCLVGADPGDPDTRVLTHMPPYDEIALSPPPVGVTLGFAKTPVWDRADASTQAAFEELSDALGDAVTAFDMPPAFERAWEWHQLIMDVEDAHHYRAYYDQDKNQLHPKLVAGLERGMAASASDYLDALAARKSLQVLFARMMEDVDAIITPAAPGEAPAGIESTGDMVFNQLWSLLGVPAISLPLMVGENDLPVGVQLVGRFGDDARLLRTANWLVGELMVE